MGRFDEAIAMRKRARDLAPPVAPIIANIGFAYYYARQYDEAIKQHQRALELTPGFARSQLAIGHVYVQMGKYGEGIAEIKKAIRSREDTRSIATLGHAYAVAGRRAEALKLIDQLEELSKRKYVPPYFIATIYAGLGERDKMFGWLEKAYHERSAFLTFIGVEPMFDSVHSDPRFVELLRRVGLPSKTL
jgi:tetratricopeptide (TPR) repeat protein